ncbi:MAG: hypothetical protein U5L04_14305 [Trueperaceae bacterium]|nr:hypothetical protein [Trueperaceae bacterium]
MMPEVLRYRALLFLLLALLGVSLPGCAPQTRPSEATASVQFFFSSEAWGGVPFTAPEKQQALVRAMLDRSVERLERGASFAAEGPVEVRRAVAVYEVDRRGDLPRLRAGYELELRAPESLLGQRVVLTNRASNVSRSVVLEPTTTTTNGLP